MFPPPLLGQCPEFINKKNAPFITHCIQYTSLSHHFLHKSYLFLDAQTEVFDSTLTWRPLMWTRKVPKVCQSWLTIYIFFLNNKFRVSLHFKVVTKLQIFAMIPGNGLCYYYSIPNKHRQIWLKMYFLLIPALGLWWVEYYNLYLSVCLSVCLYIFFGKQLVATARGMSHRGHVD